MNQSELRSDLKRNTTSSSVAPVLPGQWWQVVWPKTLTSASCCSSATIGVMRRPVERESVATSAWSGAALRATRTGSYPLSFAKIQHLFEPKLCADFGVRLKA